MEVDAIYPEDVLLPKGTANLPVTCKVLLGLIFAVTKEALVRWIGQVDEDHRAQVNAVLQRLLGLLGWGEGEGGQGAEERQAKLAVRYKDIVAGEFRADFLVDGKVVVELKAIKALTEGDEAQLLNYPSTSSGQA